MFVFLEMSLSVLCISTLSSLLFFSRILYMDIEQGGDIIVMESSSSMKFLYL